MYLVCVKQALINLIYSLIKLSSHPTGLLLSSHWVGKWINQILAPLQTIANSVMNESELWVGTDSLKLQPSIWTQQQGNLGMQSTQRGIATLFLLPFAWDVQQDSDLARGQIRAPAHPGYSKRPRQWVGTERPTIELVREDLGLRLHANFVGDIAEQSFIYKPSARLIDAFNASIV